MKETKMKLSKLLIVPALLLLAVMSFSGASAFGWVPPADAIPPEMGYLPGPGVVGTGDGVTSIVNPRVDAYVVPPVDAIPPEMGYLPRPRIVNPGEGITSIVNPTIVSPGPWSPPTNAVPPNNGYIIGGNGWLPMGN